LYHYVSQDLKELWDEGDLQFSRYPEYVNITTLLYYLPGPNRIWPEILNILASVLTVVIGYKTVLRLTDNETPAKIAGMILTVDPYMLYLSTQYLRDSLILLSTSLIVYSLTLKRGDTLVISTIMLTLLRSTQALAMSPIFFLIGPKRIIIIPLAIIALYTYANNELPYGVDLTSQVPLSPNANTAGQSHIEFFDNPNITNIPYTRPWDEKWLVFNPLLYMKAIQTFLVFPYPWDADNKVEYAFSLYMLYWYVFLGLGIAGLIAQPRIPKDILMLALWGIVLGTILTTSIGLQGAIVRWRLQAFYLLIPALSLGVSYMLTYEARRRVLDLLISFSSLIALVIIPIIPIIMIILLFTRRSGRKIFFRQERVGRYGKHFFIHKFVTMIPDSDGVALSNNDPRLTRVGAILRKTALDEIPEIWNIIKGDMAVVGPRPLAYWEHDRFEIEIPRWNERYQVMPGLTGLAQLKIKRENNPGKLGWDLEYIENRSTKYDAWIFYRGALNNITGKWH
ncbi:hypothetical protein LCGC14_2103040, partial [marine sediment metagenome]